MATANADGNAMKAQRENEGKLTILHVVHQFFPHHRHGVELSTLELAKAQAAQGHTIHLLAGEHGRFGSEVKLERDEFQGLPVTRLYLNPRTRNGFLEHEGFKRTVVEFLRTLQPDVVHLQHLSNLSLSLVDAASEVGAPIVLSLRDYSLFCARKHLLRGDGTICRQSDLVHDCQACLRHPAPYSAGERLASLPKALEKNLFNPRSWRLLADASGALGRSGQPLLSLDSIEDFERRNARLFDVLSRVDRIHGISEDLSRRFEAFLSNRVKVTSLLQAPDIEGIDHRIREVPQGPVRILSVGKFARIKGIHLLLRAFRRLPVGGAELHLYGTPTWTDLSEIAYWREMKRLGAVPGVHFHDEAVSRARLGEVFGHFDLFVMSSVCHESYGRTVAEALAAGLPVIVPRETGVAELVSDGGNGLLYDLNDEEDLVRALEKMVREPELIHEMSRNTSTQKPFATYVVEVERMYREVQRSKAEAER